MRRLVLGLAVASSALLAACGGGEVVVQAAIRPEADETAEAIWPRGIERLLKRTSRPVG